MKSSEGVGREGRQEAGPRTVSRPRWRAALAASAAAILLLLTATGFDRGVPPRDAEHAVEPGPASVLTPPRDDLPSLLPALPDHSPDELPAGFGYARPARLEAALDAFYRERAGAPAWIERAGARDGRPGAAADELIEALAAADRHALEPADYRAGELAERVAAAREDGIAGDELATLDVDLTAAFLAFAADLCCGRLERLPAAERWGRSEELPDLAASLERALAGGSVAAAFSSLAPPYPDYRSLTAALIRYRRTAGAGGWPEVPGGPPPRLGEPADARRMVALAERLRTEGYLGLEQAARLYRGWTGEGAEVRYEEPLVGAVRRFQERHGLLSDAELGEATLRELNVPAAERAEQIALNLERWRFMPRDPGERHVRVNVAGYRLSAFEDGREVLTMPVVVGRRSWRTPLFADRIAYLEVNPFWHVPSSIARREILPQAAEDPSYLKRNAYQLVNRETGETIDPASADLDALGDRVRVRQRPGRINALGRIKFIFPNRFNVYLHDTPQQSAFERSGRALSHGCVRVERPLDLAGFVLREDPEWTEERVREAIDSGRSQRIHLDRPLPVYLLYWTAFVDAEGRLHFRPDVYGHDDRVAGSLAGVKSERLAARGGAESEPRVETGEKVAGDAVGAAG